MLSDGRKASTAAECFFHALPVANPEEIKALGAGNKPPAGVMHEQPSILSGSTAVGSVQQDVEHHDIKIADNHINACAFRHAAYSMYDEIIVYMHTELKQGPMAAPHGVRWIRLR